LRFAFWSFLFPQIPQITTDYLKRRSEDERMRGCEISKKKKSGKNHKSTISSENICVFISVHQWKTRLCALCVEKFYR
jgi:hypothetical protein